MLGECPPNLCCQYHLIYQITKTKYRDEYNSQFGEGTGPLILARTDALKTDGFEAGIERCLAFREAGCDMTVCERS